MRLNIGIDLGSDSLKIAFAYTGTGTGTKKTSFQYGKFESESESIRVAMPALAYYDDVKGVWIYGDDVEKKSASSFVKVVKLKSLLSLLIPRSQSQVTNQNKVLYEQGHHFPKFFFPNRKGMDDNFQQAIDEGRTFEVKNYTPRKVLEEFFKTFVLEVVKSNVKKLAEIHQIEVSMNDIRTTVVHPPMVGDVYISELCRLVKQAFGKEPYKALSSVKALALYAFRRQMIAEGEEALIFDMGEENISVAKAFMNGKQVLIEGAEGHNEPMALGGVDVDDAIANYIETSISHRVTLGQFTPEGEAERPPERPIVGKQYLFMKNIKKAKIVLSRPDYEESTFHEGVPIDLHCELYIQRFLSRTEFDTCLGISERIVAEALAKRVRKGGKAPETSHREETASPTSTPSTQGQSGGKKGKKKKLGGLRSASSESTVEEPVTAPEESAPTSTPETPPAQESGRRFGGLRSGGGGTAETTTEPPATPPAQESSGGRRFGGLRSSGSSSSSGSTEPPQEERRFGGLRRSKLATSTPELSINPETMEVVSSVSEGEAEITPEYVAVPVDEKNSIAHKVLSYIQEELNRPTNENMTSRTPDATTLQRRGYIILSGGLVETHALLDYLKYHLKKSHPHLDVLTFDDDAEDGDIFTVLSHEDSAYAPAIGGAIVAMENYDVKTALSLSYASWLSFNHNGNSVIHLVFLAQRGATLTESGSEFASNPFSMHGKVSDEAIFSTIISQEDINAGKLDRRATTRLHNGTKKLVIGPPRSEERKKVEKLVHLQTVAGGELSLIYRGREVSVVGDTTNNAFLVRQGIRATKEGRVHPFYEVVGAKSNGHSSTTLTVRFSDGSTSTIPYSEVSVHSTINDFDSSSG